MVLDFYIILLLLKNLLLMKKDPLDVRFFPEDLSFITSQFQLF